MDLLLNYNDRSEVVLPPGPRGQGGSCDFMTATCAKECHLKSNRFQKAAFDAFKSDTAYGLFDRIQGEAKAKQIEWFVTGDCPASLTNKVAEIIYLLHGAGFIQSGFTRNVLLWEKVSQSHCRLALTVEDKEQAHYWSFKGLTAIPQYDSWRSEIILNGKSIYLCGGGIVICGSGFVEESGEIYPEDCVLCAENTRGCFAKAA